MKEKILIIFTLFFLGINNINAKESIKVTLNKCVDGDTAWFNTSNNETIKARFLAIDTPESTTTIEEFGKEASNFTCEKLSNAKKIVLEYDENSDKTDKYNRHLVWVFVDNELLQSLILKEGLAEIKYLYGDYQYTSILEKDEAYAKENKLNIWDNETENTEDEKLTFIDYVYFALAGITIICLLFSKKGRKKIANSIKKQIKKSLS